MRYTRRTLADLNSVDYVSVNIPLLIRLLEYAREDANSDLDLHYVVERMLDISKNKEVLTMSDYDDITNRLKAEARFRR